MRLSSREMLALAAVLLIAAALRFAALGEVPAGLYRDEAFYGLDAVNVLGGQHAIYFPANNGREPLFIYLVALSIGALGRSPFAERLPAAIISLLTVPAAFLMARELWGKRVGLLTAAVLAVTLWPVHLAHVGYRVGLLPLFMALTTWQAAKAWHTRSTHHGIAAGVLYGLTFYTYLAARFTPLILAALAVYAWSAHPRERTRLIRAAAPFVLSAIVIAAPLGIYAAGHWDIFMGRGEQVTIFSPGIGGPNPWLTLARNVARALGMFLWQGDRIARHNVPYRPVFDPALGVLFLIGVAIAAMRAKRDAASALALTWTGTMLLPTILAEDTPHFLRAVGVLPIIAVFPALALDKIFNVQCSMFKLNIGYWKLIISLLTISLALTTYDYFVRYAGDPTVRYWFDDAGARLAAEINRFTGTGWTGRGWGAPQQAFTPDRRVFLDRGLWTGFVNTQFLVPDQSALTFIKTGGELPAPHAGPTLLLLWPYDDWRRDLALLPGQATLEFRAGVQSKGDRDPEPITTYLVVRAEPYNTLPAPLAQFQNGPQLLSADVQGTHIRLTWYAPRKPDVDYTVFVHALRQGQQIAQHDGDPSSGLYPTSQWRPGDVVIDEHTLTGIGEQIVVGLYRRDTGVRLPVVNAAGQPTGDSLVITP